VARQDPGVQVRALGSQGLTVSAEGLGCMGMSSQLALAWVLAQGEDVVPIPGTRRIADLAENVSALDVELTPEDLAAIEEVAPVGVTAGERYSPSGMRWLQT
jgi:aryl-alcohol dehydrogenase-like predicted oxidoreductase